MKKKLISMLLAVMMVLSVSLFSVSAMSVGGDLIYGDVDGDNAVTAVDAFLILKSSVGLYNIPEDRKSNADVNMDGSIDSVDAQWTLQSSVKMRVLGWGGPIF